MRFYAMLLASASICWTALPAMAQNDDSQGDKDEVAVLDTITVSARKRDEALNDVPTAATVIGGDSIDDRGGLTTAAGRGAAGAAELRMPALCLTHLSSLEQPMLRQSAARVRKAHAGTIFRKISRFFAENS